MAHAFIFSTHEAEAGRSQHIQVVLPEDLSSFIPRTHTGETWLTSCPLTSQVMLCHMCTETQINIFLMLGMVVRPCNPNLKERDREVNPLGLLGPALPNQQVPDSVRDLILEKQGRKQLKKIPALTSGYHIHPHTRIHIYMHMPKHIAWRCPLRRAIQSQAHSCAVFLHMSTYLFIPTERLLEGCVGTYL